MSEVVIRYYEKRFGGKIDSVFIHLVREIGEIALGMEKQNSGHIKLKITEASALLHYLASRWGFELDVSMEQLYSRKLEKISKMEHD